jgi:Protein of unknown function (DUF3175)
LAGDQRISEKSLGNAVIGRQAMARSKQRMPGKVNARRDKTSARWSADVTRHSNALDLEPDVFTLNNPHEVAVSLKRSAEASTRRRSTPYRSAMSMLTFYINRAGKSLPEKQREVLERAKGELRKAFGRV